MTPPDALAFQSAFFARHPDSRSIVELFDSLPQVTFYLKDVDSRLVRVNRRFIETHGAQDESKLIGLSDRDFHPPVMAEAYIAEDRRVMASRRPITQQAWLVFHADRFPQWYASTKTPLFDPAGEVIGLAGAMHPIEQQAEHERYFRELSPVIRHLERHHAEPVSMANMAALAKLSTTHFNRRFQQLLRMTPGGYLRSVRVQSARRLLTSTRHSLAEIAQQCGFTDQSHFTRCFREATGLTPGDYRKRFRRNLFT